MPSNRRTAVVVAAALCLLAACSPRLSYDVVLRNGQIFDGSGGASVSGDLAIQGDRIAAIGNLDKAQGKVEVDVRGLAVAPGFVNMMCWANESLIHDGRSQSDIARRACRGRARRHRPQGWRERCRCRGHRGSCSA